MHRRSPTVNRQRITLAGMVLAFVALLIGALALTGCGPKGYQSCDAARAASAAPLHEGQPGWNPKLDADHDGTACEVQAPVEGSATITPAPQSGGLLSAASGSVSAVIRAIPKPSAAPSPSGPSAKPGIVLRPVTAFFSQATVDRGKLVTWTTSPTCILAGHDSRGWSWIDDIATGRVVTVATGPCAGRYIVYAHRHQRQKGGPIPSWMADPALDLVLQTCTGRSGMGFALARKI